jgi:hypothetical protein
MRRRKVPIEMPVTVAALSHRRSGPGVRTIRMAMMAKGRISGACG